MIKRRPMFQYISHDFDDYMLLLFSRLRLIDFRRIRVEGFVRASKANYYYFNIEEIDY